MSAEDASECLANERCVPTTLFKLSNKETHSAILAGYIATMINTRRYEGFPLPPDLSASIRRIQELVAWESPLAALRRRLRAATGR